MRVFLPKTNNYTKHQLKTIQKIEHNLAYMDYAMIFLSIVLLVFSIYTTERFAVLFL